MYDCLLENIKAYFQKYLQADRNAWLAVKFSLGLDFPNLPYMVDGDIRLTQSLAILRYLGRKFNLAPSNEAEQVASHMPDKPSTAVSIKAALVIVSAF